MTIIIMTFIVMLNCLPTAAPVDAVVATVVAATAVAVINTRNNTSSFSPKQLQAEETTVQLQPPFDY